MSRNLLAVYVEFSGLRFFFCLRKGWCLATFVICFQVLLLKLGWLSDCCIDSAEP